MMRPWNLDGVLRLESKLGDDDAARRVLLEYNGPQMLLFVEQGITYLAIAADEDDAAPIVRWTATEVSSLELVALADATLSLRAVFEKPTIRVLDTDPDARTLVRLWDAVAPASVAEHLPDPQVLLATAAREVIARPESTEPTLSFVRQRDEGVAFRALGALLDIYQRLWTAIGQALSDGDKKIGRWSRTLAERTELGVLAAAPGSLHLTITPKSSPLFASIADKFDELVHAGEDRDALAIAFSRLNLRVRQRYAELLEELRKHDAQLLERRGRRSAFLASYQSDRILQALPQGEPGRPETFETIGNFVSFDASGLRFELKAIDDEKYAGKVARTVVEEHSKIGVGRGALYKVTIVATVFTMQTESDVYLELVGAIELPWPAAT